MIFSKCVVPSAPPNNKQRIEHSQGWDTDLSHHGFLLKTNKDEPGLHGFVGSV